MFSDPKGPFRSAPRHRLFGVYPALVTDVADPDAQGRVQIKLPWVEESDGEEALAWARLVTLMAGADRGTWFIPEVDDEVLVSFVAGDPRRPIVIGALWNGVDAPPETMDGGGENHIRSITSESGHKLTFDDTPAAEKVEIKTQSGHDLLLDDTAGAAKIEVKTALGHKLLLDDISGDVTLEHVNGAKINIDIIGKITVKANGEVDVTAPMGMKVTAPMVTVDAALSKFSGVVKCETLITNFVVSPTYTPGVGNFL